ncbi:hypothetical protein KJ707_01615 [Patescibacteria group bacterium]|nr:hypothetical protein [Patescibacteria group bacterium]MBU1967295.1 hypothetical protein [Patescibacteria group bacterium]MBU2543250.1 hypothetical protein [Patescibacteria group bacterium]
MKTRLMIIFAFLTVVLIVAPQAMALDIQVFPDGRVEFYSGSVLGEKDEQTKDAAKQKLKVTEPKKIPVENRIKTINQGDNQELRIRTDQNEIGIELKEKPAPNSSSMPAKFESKEETKSDNVNLQFPASLSEKQFEATQKKQEEHQVYQEQLREERQQRQGEMVELKNKLRENKQLLELKSRNVKASLQQGAEFTLDPATNKVTVVTPSGQSHLLNHLPDQALERMKAAGLFDSGSQVNEEAVEVGANDQGELVYKKKDQIKKRFLGLFPRQINSEIVLNDATGEVTEQEVAPSSLFEQFLNAVSF